MKKSILSLIVLIGISIFYFQIIYSYSWRDFPMKNADAKEILKIDILFTILYGIIISALILFLNFFKEIKSIKRIGLKFVCYVSILFFVMFFPIFCWLLGKEFILPLSSMLLFGSFVMGLIFESKN